MNDLLKVAKILNRVRIRKMETLHNLEGTARTNPHKILFDALVKGEVVNDKEAARLVGYHKKGADYRKFKSRFEKLLLNSFFFIDFNKRKSSLYTKAAISCYTNQQILKILLLLGANETTEWLALKTMAKAVKFELTDVQMDCAKALKSISYLKGNHEAYTNYQNIFDENLEIYKWEEQARGWLYWLYSEFANTGEIKKAHGKKALDYANRIEESNLKSPSTLLDTHRYFLKGLGFYILQEYEASIQQWEEFESMLILKTHLDNRHRIAESALNRLGCYLHTRNHIAAENAISVCKNFFWLGKTIGFTLWGNTSFSQCNRKTLKLPVSYSKKYLQEKNSKACSHHLLKNGT